MTKILIIEDSKTYSNTLLALLRKPNFEILQAFTIKQAHEKIDETPDIDYILLDLILPDGEGDELILNLSDKKNKSKIIVLTGSSDIQRRNYLFEHGVVDYFSKETPLKTLVKDLHNLIINLSKNKEKEILVVDDSSFVRRSITNILETKNYKISSVKDGQEAIDFLKHHSKINLIFLDLEMPKISGTQVLELIKKDTRTKNIPVIILSSSEDRQKYAYVIKHGAIDFMKKPFLTEEILLKADLHISQAEYIETIAEQAKELNEYKRVLNESDIISKTDPRGIITQANDKFCEISGYSQEYLLGKSHNIVRHPDMPKKIYEDMWKHIKEHKTFKGIIKNLRRDGTSYYVDATISPIIDIDGNIKEIIGIRHDITDVMNPKKQLLADLSYLENPTLIFLQIANYDLFKEFYSETLMHTFEFEFEQVILNYFPYDFNLKKVYNLNNGLFAFLKNEELSDGKIEYTLKKVIEKFKEIGISFMETSYDVDICISYAKEGNHILDDAYLAIQHALKYKIPIIDAKNFHRRAQIEARNKLKNIGIIKDALAKEGSFISYFQPIINNRTNKIEKYESLIRLIDKNGNILSPFQFLDVAKKTGYYSDITELVIQNSFNALKHTDKGITINLSSSDIENSKLRTLLWKLVSKKENHGRVTFELLEDEEVKDFDLVKEFILKSKMQAGVTIAIDDFGSGYSNYERLLQFQPDILKIDGSLIKNILTDEYSKHVVESIIVFAVKQKIKTVAEFVGNDDVLQKIKELGIDYSQGYFLGEPKRLF
ncbi:EAL domain-containing protein [Arcobacter roscoffensis]|uniref:EAL domain-containing protein n=1 Tax=Arcobacter roscoffensis TaxID=2961520 RepID=A0ABY5E485_9BACT|nr:EAL domain-containing protein [Arcobacter roscoffensis]UTJ06964.1 EAL domain-containing protein [Arcobacter roscoffensis]